MKMTHIEKDDQQKTIFRPHFAVQLQIFRYSEPTSYRSQK